MAPAGESSKDYAVFRVYRDLPPTQRTVVRAATEAGISRRSAYDLCKRWSWVDRVDAWDDECHQTEDRERLEQIRQMHKVHRSAGRLAVGKAMQALNQLQPSEMNPSQIARLLSLGAKLERDTLIVSVEELQGVDEIDEGEPDPWEQLMHELTPDDVAG